MPTMTFVATANAVEHAGATPVFVDSEPVTGLADLDAVEAADVPRTRVLPSIWPDARSTSTASTSCATAMDWRWWDAAHALGAEWHGRRIGTHGNLTAFSFYATKNITTAEGGALATSDPAVAAAGETHAARAQCGCLAAPRQRVRPLHRAGAGLQVQPGPTSTPPWALHQLPRLDEWTDRAELWDRYDELLADLPLTTPVPPDPDTSGTPGTSTWCWWSPRHD